MSVVRLSVHKNQRDRRRAKEVRDRATRAIQDAQASFGTKLAGFALIAWDEGGASFAAWHNRPKNSGSMADFIRGEINKHIIVDAAEDRIKGPPPDDDA